MARTDNDTWDVASSVGATATMVAAQRVLATREGLIDDPFAEPLVRAVGNDFFNRLVDGEIDFGRRGPGIQPAPRPPRAWPCAPASSTACSRRRHARVFVRR